MPIINKQDVPKSVGSAPGLEVCVLVGAEQGSQSLHIEEVTVAPNARIPRGIQPHTEVAIIVLEGTLDAIIERQRTTVGPGHTVLVPAGTADNLFEVPEDGGAVVFAAFPLPAKLAGQQGVTA